MQTFEEFEIAKNAERAFGPTLKNARENAGHTRETLATQVVELAADQEADITRQIEARKVEIAQQIAVVEEQKKTLEAEIQASAELKSAYAALQSVTAIQVEDWEANTAVPSTQCVEMLAEIFSLKVDKKDEFIRLANEARENLGKPVIPGHSFGDTLKQLRRAIPVSVADMVVIIHGDVEKKLKDFEPDSNGSAGEKITPDALDSQIAALRKEQEAENQFSRPVFVIIDGVGKELSLRDEAGHTLIIDDHIEMIEKFGMYPSPDLTKTLIEAIAKSGKVDQPTLEALEAKYKELAQELPASVREKYAPSDNLSASTPLIQQESNPNEAVTPEVGEEIGTPLSHRNNSPLREAITRYAEVYADLFQDKGLTPPSGNNTQGGDVKAGNGSRAQLAVRLGVDRNKSIAGKLSAALNPTNLDDIPNALLNHGNLAIIQDQLIAINDARTALREQAAASPVT